MANSPTTLPVVDALRGSDYRPPGGQPGGGYFPPMKQYGMGKYGQPRPPGNGVVSPQVLGEAMAPAPQPPPVQPVQPPAAPPVPPPQAAPPPQPSRPLREDLERGQAIPPQLAPSPQPATPSPQEIQRMQQQAAMLRGSGSGGIGPRYN